jgi:hypothetical protein
MVQMGPDHIRVGICNIFVFSKSGRRTESAGSQPHIAGAARDVSLSSFSRRRPNPSAIGMLSDL